MAKPKKTENMSLLDYLYKELSRLAKKIETSSGGKISERDLLIYSLIIIFILSARFGGVIGAFTFILAVATIWNARITQGLLKQSKEALGQSRISFLVSIVDKTIDHVVSLGRTKQLKQVEYTKNKTKAIYRISPEGSLEFLEAMIDWSKPGSLLQVELEKYRKSYKIDSE